MSREYVLENFKTEFHPQIAYERELNPQQLAAVTAPPGPALVIAGGWRLSLGAKVQGETGTLENKLEFRAIP